MVAPNIVMPSFIKIRQLVQNLCNRLDKLAQKKYSNYVSLFFLIRKEGQKIKIISKCNVICPKINCFPPPRFMDIYSPGFPLNQPEQN
jgi:hypothetical protein